MAYQFHRENLREGMFLAFRRSENQGPTLRLRLCGLDPQARYELDLEGGKRILTGAALRGGIDWQS